jgi:hypothetical protein
LPVVWLVKLSELDPPPAHIAPARLLVLEEFRAPPFQTLLMV